MIAPLERLDSNPILRPEDIPFTRAAGAFNPGVTIDHRSGRVVILVRVFEAESRRSCVGLALSSDGVHVDEVWDRPAIAREAAYEEWGVEDVRVTYLADEGRYAITYCGYSPDGPRVCLITTDDILDPSRYVRHGLRMAGLNKNALVFPEKIGGKYVVLHRPLPCAVLAEVDALEDAWPESGTTILGPRPASWRSARVGAGAPPIRTRLGWLLPFHGATTIEEGNVYSMGWCLLDASDPRRVRYVSPQPVLTPTAPYEIHAGPIPQVDMASFNNGIRVVFPEGLVERDGELLVYYGASDVNVGVARVAKDALIDSLEEALGRGEGDVPA
jgi:predicted GH43/DUF377 family glycosyl hydrolase